MAHYLIGDIQGCDAALDRLLQAIDFSPSRDTIYPLGDLVNRGPESPQVLRRLLAYGSSAKPVLGNHDVSLLALAVGVYTCKPKDTMLDVLSAPDAVELLSWLRQQPLARFEQGVLMVHAGVLPQWSVKKTLKWAQRLGSILREQDLSVWLPRLWGNPSGAWTKSLTKQEKLCLALNALTRIRFCDVQGRMDFTNKSAYAREGTMSWFEVPGRKTAMTPIAFGHWSTLGLYNEPYLIGLDTGCVWGGELSAMKINPFSVAYPHSRVLIQVKNKA